MFANGGSISHRPILQSVLPPGNRRSVLGITRLATGAEVQKNMSGPQPCSRYLAGSRYQVGKESEMREGFGKVLEKQEGYVGTAVGSIPCANTSYDLSVEMQGGFFAESSSDEKREEKALSWTIFWYKRTRSDLVKQESLSLSWMKYWYERTRIPVLVACE